MYENRGLAIPRRRARVEIIPLIDVVFFLLATFVLFTLALEKMGVIETPLPVPTKDRPEEDFTVYIQASAEGTFYWKKGRFSPVELITKGEIRPRLDAYKNQVRIPRVMVRADNQAKLGSAIFILDEVRLAKIDQVSLETSPSKPGD
jgi:biopolymer transport protein ExbD